jgi:hypothetical protein
VVPDQVVERLGSRRQVCLRASQQRERSRYDRITQRDHPKARVRAPLHRQLGNHRRADTFGDRWTVIALGALYLGSGISVLLTQVRNPLLK